MAPATHPHYFCPLAVASRSPSLSLPGRGRRRPSPSYTRPAVPPVPGLPLAEQPADVVHALKDTLHARLIAKTETDELTGCWIWTGAWQRDTGLGVMRICGKLFTVGRVGAWVYRGGFDLCDMTVRAWHKCRCGACFNPAHVVMLPVGLSVQDALARLGPRVE